MQNIVAAVIAFWCLTAGLEPPGHFAAGLAPPKHGGVYVVAHRGAHEGIPENTLPAYARAIELGADFVEIDVRTTKDGRLVSIHNASVESYAEGHSGRVAEMTYDELRALDVGARIAPEWVGTRIPLVEDILDLCRNKIGIYLDLKAGDVATLVDMVKERGMEKQVLWYASLSKLRELEKSCPSCIAMPDPGPEKNLKKLIAAFQPAVVASVWRHYSKSFVDTVHDAGAIVIVDEDDPGCWEDALKWKSDGIQTDHPAALIEWLAQNRQNGLDSPPRKP